MHRTPTIFVAIGCALFTRSVYAVDGFQESQSRIVGWAPSPSTRGTLDIFWSCLFTVVACVWTILHPNVPAPGQHRILLRKIKWAFANVILPEIILYAAILDRYEVRKKMDLRRGLCEPCEDMGGWTVPVPEKHPWRHRVSAWRQKYPLLGIGARLDEFEEGNDPRLWTLTHEIYLRMGGLRLQVKDPNQPDGTEVYTLRSADLIFPGKDSLQDPRISKAFSLSENEILDKSKGDGFSKTITTVQLVYFVVSLCARRARNLPISQLEILTLAFAVLAVMTYFALWDRPQGIKVPTTIHLDKFHEPVLRDDTNTKGSVLRDNTNKTASAKDLIHNSDLESYATDSVYMTIVGLTLSSAPFILTLIMAGFAGFHFLAWNFDFPSTAELVIWRAAAIVTLSLPFGLYVLTGANLICCLHCLQYGTIWVTFIAVYGLARLLLIVIAFTSLRSMPSGTYLTTWSGNVPHFQ